MISTSDRKMAIELIEEAKQSGAREIAACKELGISQRTLQRWRSPSTPLEDQRPVAKRPTPKNKLSEAEVTQILETVNQPEFQSLPPSQIVPRLADMGIYIASESTIYHVLRKQICRIIGDVQKCLVRGPFQRIALEGPTKSGCGTSPGCAGRLKACFSTCI
jgi:hypothetical protein